MTHRESIKSATKLILGENLTISKSSQKSRLAKPNRVQVLVLYPGDRRGAVGS